MAIKIRDYSSLSDLTKDSHLYKDIKLDISWIKQKTVQNGDSNMAQLESIRDADISPIYDEDVIRTSLFNLFNTSKGQRFLFPEYGVDIRKYLFMPLDEATARMLGDDIRLAITRFEKRVSVLKVNVDLYNDEQTMVVTISVFSDTLGKAIDYNMQVSQTNVSQPINVYSSGSF